MAQNFKGDPTELKMQNVVNPILDVTNTGLDEFYAQGFDCDTFLLMLYDEQRMPFSQRIKRKAFVDFIKQALANFPFIGTFESYLFILRSVFGVLSEVFFNIPSPGKLQINVNATSSLEFDFIAREFVDGAYVFYNVITSPDMDLLEFRGISGIETEYELKLLFSEIMPAGITPDITLVFFARYDWISEESSVFYNMTDDDDNQIIFIEIGG